MNFRRCISGALLIAAAALSLASWHSDAHAQAAFYPAHVQVQWRRLGTGTDNPFASLTPPQSYLTPISNGNHQAGNAGVAVGVEDTSDAIPIWDHWLRTAAGIASVPAPGTALLADSSWFGTLLLKSNLSTIDTVTYFLDHSGDGYVWTVRDSLSGHVISDRPMLTLGVPSDSGRVALASFSGASGAVGATAGLTFTANPFFGPGGVTAQSLIGVNFVRVRIHMTPGDFAAAGTNRGVTAEWVYPAVDANPNARVTK